MHWIVVIFIFFLLFTLTKVVKAVTLLFLFFRSLTLISLFCVVAQDTNTSRQNNKNTFTLIIKHFFYSWYLYKWIRHYASSAGWMVVVVECHVMLKRIGKTEMKRKRWLSYLTTYVYMFLCEFISSQSQKKRKIYCTCLS